jgi:hypothetical protein
MLPEFPSPTTKALYIMGNHEPWNADPALDINDHLLKVYRAT